LCGKLRVAACLVTLCPSFYHPAGTKGQQGEPATSFLATLASSSTEEMEAELQERLESSQKQVTRVVELYEGLKSTVERLRVEPNAGAGGERRGAGRQGVVQPHLDRPNSRMWVGVCGLVCACACMCGCTIL